MFSLCTSVAGSVALNGIRERCISVGSNKFWNATKASGSALFDFSENFDLASTVAKTLYFAGTIAATCAFVSFTPFAVLPLKVALVAFAVSFIASAVLRSLSRSYENNKILSFMADALAEGGRTTLLASINPMALALYLGIKISRSY